MPINNGEKAICQLMLREASRFNPSACFCDVPQTRKGYLQSHPICVNLDTKTCLVRRDSLEAAQDETNPPRPYHVKSFHFT